MPKLSSVQSGAPSSGKPPARPYQADGRAWLETGPARKFLADEPGLGKSRQLIEASRGKTLVVAPAMVLDGGTWDDEIARWADDPGRFTQAAYSSLNARVVGPRGGSVPTEDLKDEYREEEWDTGILDESQYVKGRKTKWTVAVQRLKVDRLYLASGTPIPNWADELFVPLQLLFPEEARPGGRFGSYWRWAKEWFDCSPNRFSQGNPVVGDLLACGPSCFDRPPLDPCEHYLEFHEANLGDRFLQRLRDDVLTDLPALTVQRVETPMVAAQKKVYRELKRDFVTWAAGSGEELVAWNAAAQNEILTKVCVGLEVVGFGSGSGKLDRLRYDLSNRSRPTLVVAHHQDVLETAKTTVCDPMGLRAATVHGGTSKGDRGRRVAAFKSGGLDVLLGSLDTISEGLTLTSADVCIFLEKSYKPSRNQQAMRRIHRLGQDRPCTVLEYITPDTVDERKEERLETKTDRQMRHLKAAEFASML